jgi:hypothetical protein
MFEIKILDQYWIDKEEDNQDDLCSHGLLFIKVNDTIITDEKDDDWTISTTALQLLRTIDSNHNINPDYPIVQHCGQLEFAGCPISIDWESMVFDNSIKISKVQKLRETNEKYTIYFPGLESMIPKNSYIDEVINFTDNVINFFKGHNPKFENDFDKNNYNLFWQELNQLLNKYKN